MPIIYREIDEELPGNAHSSSTSSHHRSSAASSSSPASPAAPVYASLDDLVSLLRRELAVEPASQRPAAFIARITALLEQYRLNEEEWSKYASWKGNGYTRNLIGYDQKFTMLLLCWTADQKSAIHDHSESSCWMKILKGRMRETRYAFPGYCILKPLCDVVLSLYVFIYCLFASDQSKSDKPDETGLVVTKVTDM